MVSPQIQKLAQRLLALEAARGPAPDEDVGVVMQVIEQFRVRLIKLAGVHGFRSLLSRALTVAKVSVSSLQTVSVDADGRLVGLDEAERKSEAEQSGAVLLAHLLDLLIKFIGESLTLQLVSDVWPDLSADDVI